MQYFRRQFYRVLHLQRVNVARREAKGFSAKALAYGGAWPGGNTLTVTGMVQLGQECGLYLLYKGRGQVPRSGSRSVRIGCE